MGKIMSIFNRCDVATRGHQLRVSALATSIASYMGLSSRQVNNVRLTGMVHDIGKIFLPPEFAYNNDELSPYELEIVRRHPKVGFDLLDGFGLSKTIRQSVLQHHEHIDGSGYPNNLKGDQISIEAKIVSVADVVDAMTSNRPYNKSLNLVDAINEITRNQGRYFDQDVVNAYLGLVSSAFRYQNITTTGRSSCRLSC